MTSKYAGYMGRVMMVDLTTETVTEYPWTDEQRELYLGGKIMAARILCDHLTGREAAFSEENWVVISTGPLTGTGAPSSARFNISALSPQTGILASSNCGGSFGFHLKKAGFDALILKGKCDGHKWLEINEDQFIFHDADELWGLKVGPCQEKLAELTGKKKFGKLCIGPAGENLVKYAGIISDERAAGRAFTRGCVGYVHAIGHTLGGLYGVPHGLAMSVLLPHVMREFGASAHQRLADLADVCGIGGANEAEKANNFIRWIEETNEKMGLPNKFDVIQDKDIDQMITWATKEANPLYPVPVVWARKDFRRVIEGIRK